ncbi:MAG: TlpA family protein disulfide reductase [Sedimenticola sp.]|nr:TlpA family protein disulfide reductase [Sedimenticola sp.]
MRGRSRAIPFVGVMILWLLFGAAVWGAELPPLTHSLTPSENRQPAPALRLQNMDEEMVDIRDLKGRVVVVNFWATWCPPCRREMGSLERLYQATREKRVEVLAVNIGEDIDTVFSFLGTVEPSPGFPMLFDFEAASMESWGVKGLPTTYIIAPDGTIAYSAVGGREFDHPEILRQVLELAVE